MHIGKGQRGPRPFAPHAKRLTGGTPPRPSSPPVLPSAIGGPDPDAHVAAVREYADAGFDEVAKTQIGPDQDGFSRFYERELRNRLTT